MNLSRSISSPSSSSWGEKSDCLLPNDSHKRLQRRVTGCDSGLSTVKTQWSAAKTKSFLLQPFKVKERGGTTSSKWLKRLDFDLINLSVNAETQIKRLDVLRVTSALSYRCKTLSCRRRIGSSLLSDSIITETPSSQTTLQWPVKIQDLTSQMHFATRTVATNPNQLQLNQHGWHNNELHIWFKDGETNWFDNPSSSARRKQGVLADFSPFSSHINIPDTSLLVGPPYQNQFLKCYKHGSTFSLCQSHYAEPAPVISHRGDCRLHSLLIKVARR